MIYLIGDIAEFTKSFKQSKDNTKRNLIIAGGLLGAGVLGTVAVKSYLRNGKLVKNYSKSNKRKVPSGHYDAADPRYLRSQDPTVQDQRISKKSYIDKMNDPDYSPEERLKFTNSRKKDTKRLAERLKERYGKLRTGRDKFITPKLTSKQKLELRRKAINDNVNNNLKPYTATNFDDYLDITTGGRPTFGDYFTDLKLDNDTIKAKLSKGDTDYSKDHKQQVKKQVKMIADKLRQRNAYYNKHLNLTNF